MYYNVDLNNFSRTFNLTVVDKRADKLHSAKTTLNQIHDIMRENLQYSGEGEACNLKEAAAAICDNFLAKTQKMSGIRRFFGGVSKKENEIKEINRRIQNYVRENNMLQRGGQPYEMEIAKGGPFDAVKQPSREPRFQPQKRQITLTGLAPELITNICKYISWKDFGELEKVNKAFFKGILLYPRLLVARCYGFDDSGGGSVDEKIGPVVDYINKEMDRIKFLAESDLIPERYVVRDYAISIAGMRLFPNINAAKMLDNTRRLAPVKREEYVAYLNSSLATCIEQNRIKQGIALIREGAHPNIKDDFGRTLLHKAAMSKYYQMIPEIIDLRVDVNSRTNKGNTALLIALEDRDLPISVVDSLLKNGADPNCVNNNGWFPLRKVFHYNPNRAGGLINMLCAYGADINHPTLTRNFFSGYLYLGVLRKCNFNWSSRNEDGDTLLMYLINKHCFKSVKKLLAVDSSTVNVASNNKLPLNEILRCLISMNILCYRDYAPAVLELCKKGANINAIDYGVNYPIHQAAWFIDISLAQILLDHGADPNQETLDGKNTPLTLALRGYECDKRIKVLLENGAEVNRAPTRGRPPLGIVLNAVISANEVSELQIKVLRVLCEHGVDLNASHFGTYPLHIAAARSKELTRLFLDHGADPRALDESGKTALDNALPQCRKLLKRRLQQP